MSAKYLCLLCLYVCLSASCAEIEPMPTWPAAVPETMHTTRPATVVVPAQYTPEQAWPLLLAFHGYTSNSQAMTRFLDLQNLADRYGFVAVVPDGTKDPTGAQFWNIELACCDFLEQGVDDKAYVDELLAEITAAVHIDPERITLLGSSNGGFFSYQLACAMPGRFRQIISVAGAAPVDPAVCEYPAPVSTIQIHGTADSIVSYTDNVGTKDVETDDVLALETAGAAATAARMRSYNGCNDAVTVSAERDYTDSVAGTETTVEIWQDCSSEHTVELWSINGVDHVIPYVANDALVQAVGARIAAPTP